jgi:hypothetical protein
MMVPEFLPCQLQREPFDIYYRPNTDIVTVTPILPLPKGVKRVGSLRDAAAIKSPASVATAPQSGFAASCFTRWRSQARS